LSDKKRRQYIREFKKEAVELVTRQNYSIFQAAQSLGINGNMLARWRREYGDRERNAFPGTGHQPGETLS